MITLPVGFDVNVFLSELFSFMALAVVPIGVFYAGVIFVRIFKRVK